MGVKIDNSNKRDRNKTYEGKAEEEGRWDKSTLLDTEPTYKRSDGLFSKAAVKINNNFNEFHDSIICIISEFLVYRYDPQFCALKLSQFYTI